VETIEHSQYLECTKYICNLCTVAAEVNSMGKAVTVVPHFFIDEVHHTLPLSMCFAHLIKQTT